MLTIIKILGFLFLFIFVFDLCTRWLCDPYDIVLYFGVPGCGKTTILTKLAVQYLNKGWDVYSTIRIPGVKLIDVRKSLGFVKFPENSVILTDEANLVYDNRQFMNMPKETVEALRGFRHDRIKIIFFSQTWNDLDKKIRSMIGELWYCRKVFRAWTFSRRIFKKIRVGGGRKKGDDGEEDDQIREGYYYHGLLGGLSLTFIPRWIHLFDSYVDLQPNRSQPVYEKIPVSDTQALEFNNKTHRRAVLRRFKEKTWGKRFEYLAAIKHRFSKHRKK